MMNFADSPFELLDSVTLRDRLMGDEELVAQVLAACVPDLNANFRDFVEAIESEQFVEARQCIHAMKGASLNANLNGLAEFTRLIEESLRAGETDFARANVERLDGIVVDTIGAMRIYLGGSN